jgi:hypothetical protein
LQGRRKLKELKELKKLKWDELTILQDGAERRCILITPGNSPGGMTTTRLFIPERGE